MVPDPKSLLFARFRDDDDDGARHRFKSNIPHAPSGRIIPLPIAMFMDTQALLTTVRNLVISFGICALTQVSAGQEPAVAPPGNQQQAPCGSSANSP